MLKQERRHAPSGNLIFLLLFVWNELFEMAKELVAGCGVEPRNTKTVRSASGQGYLLPHRRSILGTEPFTYPLLFTIIKWQNERLL